MKFKNVEDIYPLSSLQQLMLLRYLSSKKEEKHFEQLKFTIQGSLSSNGLRKAWDYVIQRHASLRTVFYWQNLSKPVQVVRRKVEDNFSYHDCRGEDKTVDELIDLQTTTDGKSIDRLDQAPLVYMAAFAVNKEAHAILITYHPIVLDGWSMATVLKEFFNQLLIAEDIQVNRSKPVKFRDYIAWLQQRDTQIAELWWKQYLKGFYDSTPLWVDRTKPSSSTENRKAIIDKNLSMKENDRLLEYARNNRTTLNAMVQLSWAMLLSRYSDKEDILFGVAVSGRPPELEGIETMVGTFINNIPVRIRIKPNDQTVNALKALTMDLQDLKDYEYVSPTQIQQWSEISTSERLYESLVLFQNFPLEGTFEESGRNFTVCDVDKDIQTNFPLTLVCLPYSGLDLQLIYNEIFWKKSSVKKILDDFVVVLMNMIESSNTKVESLLASIKKPLSGESYRFLSQSAISDSSQSNIAPLSKAEETIAEIWREILGLKAINPTDNFFDLGGRSLQVIAVHNRLRDLGYKSLSLVELFEYPTVSQLASKLIGDNDKGTSIHTRIKKREGRVSSRRERMKKIRNS